MDRFNFVVFYLGSKKDVGPILAKKGQVNALRSFIKGKISTGKDSLDSYIKEASSEDTPKTNEILEKKYAEQWANRQLVKFCFEKFEAGVDIGLSEFGDEILWDIASLWVQKHEPGYAEDRAYIQAVRRALGVKMSQRNYDSFIRSVVDQDIYEQLDSIVKNKVNDVRDLDIVLELDSKKATEVLIENAEALGAPKEYIEYLNAKGELESQGVKVGKPRQVVKKDEKHVREVKQGALNIKRAPKIYITTMNELIACVIRLTRNLPITSWVFVTPSGGAKTLNTPAILEADRVGFLRDLDKYYVDGEVDVKTTKRIQVYVFNKLIASGKAYKVSDIKRLELSRKFAKELGITLRSKSKS